MKECFEKRRFVSGEKVCLNRSSVLLPRFAEDCERNRFRPRYRLRAVNLIVILLDETREYCICRRVAINTRAIAIRWFVKKKEEGKEELGS